jgi:hypothetical protein
VLLPIGSKSYLLLTVSIIMYLSNESFEQSHDGKLKLWRYMDFTKFVSLLETHKLYFNRSDMFNDHFEGSSAKMNVLARGDMVEKT